MYASNNRERERDDYNCRLLLYRREKIIRYPLFPLSDVASAKSFRHKPLLQALQIRISDRQRSVLLTYLTYFSLGAISNVSSSPGPHDRLSYPSAVFYVLALTRWMFKSASATLVKKISYTARTYLHDIALSCPLSFEKKFKKNSIFTRNPGIQFPMKNRAVLITRVITLIRSATRQIVVFNIRANDVDVRTCTHVHPAGRIHTRIRN